MNEEFSSRSLLRSPWREVAVLHRHICRLHSEGRDDEAQLIKATEFAAAAAQAHSLADPPVTEAQLAAALEREADRVADAIALFELLAPLLKTNSFAAVRPNARPAGPISGKTPPAETPSVADFIEDMLAQERGPRN